MKMIVGLDMNTKYSKYEKCLSMMMLIRIQQHLKAHP